MKTYRGSCLCGDVTFEISGPLREVIACHCSQCRKTSGHYWAATQTENVHLILTSDVGIKWYRSSKTAERGFCTTCGASLFWRVDGETTTSIGAGCFDETGLSTAKHIYTKDKGDYYEIEPGVPCS